ncbi:DUF4336 domain-containing protein [Balamuthia mandrillaris]
MKSLRRLHPQVWVAEKVMRYVPGASLRTRMTVLSLSSPDAEPELAVISPIELTPGLREDLEALGGKKAVKHVISPNKAHHLFAAGFQEAFPEAKFYAPAGLREKKDKEKLAHYHHLIYFEGPPEEHAAFASLHFGTSASPFARPRLQFIPIQGMPMLDELLFFHPSSGTLVLTDLAFNIPRGEPLAEDGVSFAESPLAYLYVWAMGVGRGHGEHRLVPSKVIASRLVVKRPKEMVGSLERARQEWGNLQRVIMAHGQVIEGEAEANRARDEMIAAYKSRLRA